MKHYRVMNSYPGEEFGKHEYDIIVNDTDKGTKYSLIRSQAAHWTENVRGETAVALLDDGDNLKLSKHIKRLMDYGIVSELFILLSFINKESSSSTNRYFMGTIEEVKNPIII